MGPGDFLEVLEKKTRIFPAVLPAFYRLGGFEVGPREGPQDMLLELISPSAIPVIHNCAPINNTSCTYLYSLIKVVWHNRSQ